MDLNEIQSLIKFVSKSGASEVELETKDFKITIKTDNPKKKRGQASDEQPQTVIHTQMPMAAMPQMAPQMQPQQPVAAPAPQQQAPAAPAAEPAEQKEDESKYVTIKSPMIGTFYRSPAPDKPTFKNVGDQVAEGEVVCIIEAMKLFNEIESEISGKIVKVLAEDATPVEYDQPLFLVDPS